MRGFARFPGSLLLVAAVAAGAAAVWAVDDPSYLTFPPSRTIRATALPSDGAIDVNRNVRLSVPVFRYERDRRAAPLFGIPGARAARSPQIAAGPPWPTRLTRLDSSIPGSGFGRAPPLA